MSQSTFWVQFESVHFPCIFDSASQVNIISFDQFQTIQNSTQKRFELQPVNDIFFSIDSKILDFHGFFYPKLRVASNIISAKVLVSRRAIHNPILNLPTYLALQ